jgi:hypothetical protein
VKYNVKNLNSVEQKLFIYDNFIQHPSGRKCQGNICRKHPDSTVPCKATMYNIKTNLHSAGSVLVKEKS